jgi:hypothetical protein
VVQGYSFYIAGKWVNPLDRKRLETINPATREVLATFPQGTKEDVALAVKAAKNASEKSPAKSPLSDPPFGGVSHPWRGTRTTSGRRIPPFHRKSLTLHVASHIR